MTEHIIKRIANLLTVKSLVTLALTATFCILTAYGAVPQELNSVYMIVVGFYFGTQATKESGV